MQSRNFFISIMVVIVVVSVLTSWVGVRLMQPVLMAPEQEGTIMTGETMTSTNVIIIDSTVVTEISDTVDFGAISPGDQLSTDKTGAGVYPFLLRNEGNADADVQAKFKTSRLFTQSDSYTYLWAADADQLASIDPGWDSIDDCVTHGGCLNNLPDCGIRGDCTLTTSDMYILRSLNFENCVDEAYLHVGLDVSVSESGSHSAIVEITGSQSGTQAAVAC